MNPQLSSFLNLSRWFAAFLVLIAHIRHLILVDYKFVVHKTLFNKALYFVTGLGHEAVVIFFVISGFLVGALTFERWKKQGPNITTYAYARISRIYTVLVPALVIGVTLDLIGLNWFNASELYTNSAQYNTVSLNNVISNTINLPTFFSNLFMLQGILTTSLGSNGPLWSLAYEWWYYCLFALIGAALTQAGNKRIAYIGIAAIIALLLPQKIILWGSIWALGIVAYYWISFSALKPHPVLGIGLFLATIVIARLSHNVDNLTNHESMLAEFMRDFSLGIAYVIALASTSKMTTPFRFAHLHEKLADFSYSTYLFHFPAMLFMTAVVYQVFGLKFQVQPQIYGILYFVLLSIIVYLYCFVLSFITERHTAFVRKKLDALLSKH